MRLDVHDITHRKDVGRILRASSFAFHAAAKCPTERFQIHLDRRFGADIKPQEHTLRINPRYEGDAPLGNVD